MDKEKSEQIKIVLLGVIAVLLIVQTVQMQSGPAYEEPDPPNRIGASSATINDMGGITVNPGINPIVNPGAQAVPQITPQPAAPTPREVTTMTFDQTDLQLGTVSLADNKTYTYNVTNTGPLPLTFDQITADAGVTIVSRPTAPIAPGGKGAITVQLSADVGTGQISKTIHVGSNTEPSHMHLTLAADVK